MRRRNGGGKGEGGGGTFNRESRRLHGGGGGSTPPQGDQIHGALFRFGAPVRCPNPNVSHEAQPFSGTALRDYGYSIM